MNRYLEQVGEFMTTFGQEVNDKPTVISEDINKLRIALIFEELKEYAEASGMSQYFADLSIQAYEEFVAFDANIGYVPVVNQVEQLDALLDLQYVLSGAVQVHGFGNIFDDAFNEVHSSNMSKVCESFEVAAKTMFKYSDEGIPSWYDTNKLPVIVYRKKDNKVLKSINYKPAELTQFLK